MPRGPSDKIEEMIDEESEYKITKHRLWFYFKQPIHVKLAAQSALLAMVAAVPLLYYFYPASAASYIGATNPNYAVPRILPLAIFGVVMQIFSGVILIYTGFRRIKLEPLTEKQAEDIVTDEAFASLLGLGIGGLAILTSLAIFSVGIFGLETYVSTFGANPLEPVDMPINLGGVATFSFCCGVLMFLASQVLRDDFLSLHYRQE